MSDEPSIEKITIDDDDCQTPEERLQFLRQHGVEVETVEERKAAQSTKNVSNPYNSCVAQIQGTVNPTELAGIDIVYIPQDSSIPIKTLKLPLLYAQSLPSAFGDLIVNFVRPAFADGATIDQTLLNETADKQFSTGGDSDMKKLANQNVTASSMNQVSKQGSVETFPLVHPADTNSYTGVYIYLDEVGMLKKLPLNPRAQALAGNCGYSPAPKFYGNVFVGRVCTKPVMTNTDFSSLAGDCDGGAVWMKRAVSENLAWQQSLNQATGRNDLQPANKGEEGKAEVENGYSWKQEDSEVELTVALPDGPLSSKKYVKVQFMNQKVVVKYDTTVVLELKVYTKVDPDGCTWTIEKGALIVTLEKAESGSWPRIEG